MGGFLGRVEGGESPVVVVLAAAAAVLVGLVLLIGCLVPARRRKLILSKEPEGHLTARRRALRQAVAALVERPRRVEIAKSRARPARRGAGGRLRLELRSPRGDSDHQIEAEARERLAPLADRFKLKIRIRAARDLGRVR